MAKKLPQPPKEERCCGSCRHWLRTGEVGEDAQNGVCRRYPPQISVSEEGAVCIQPYTEMSDFCGEHAPVLQ